MLLIGEPGTIDDMVADAAERGYRASVRLIRDWSEQGLLDRPQKRPTGKGHGSAPAIYSANQRNLLLTLLHHRQGNHIRRLARIPVAIWMYWGEEYVPLRQARLALMTWLGDPRSSKQAARDAARAILGQIDSPSATSQARRELVAVLTDANYTGTPDFPRIEQAIRAVFEPGSRQIRRVAGHPDAPMMTESMIGVMKARLAAVSALMADQVTDEALLQARDAHLFAYADYAANQPFLAAFVSASIPQLYEPVTAETALHECCGHLLSTIGLELTYPAEAERFKSARAFLRRPNAATFGFVAPADPAGT
ncbi:MAG: hypothetical protein ACRDPY_40265 [Streptosporangiaceae bacterium]